MKRKLLPTLLSLAFAGTLPATTTHLDIMVPDLKDTDLIGPVKSVELQLWENIAGEFTTEKREFDRTGNLTKITEWDENDELVDISNFFYDDNGCYVRMSYENKKDDYTHDWTVVLSPETRQIALKEAMEGRIAIESYTEAGYLKDYKLLDSNKKQIIAYSYERDEENRKTKYVRYRGTAPQYTFFFKWADNGFIDMEGQIYHQEKAKRRHTYEYLVTDEYGNWTQRIMVRYDIGGKKPVKVYENTVQRMIEYYEDDLPEAVDDESSTASESNGEAEDPANKNSTTDTENPQEDTADA